MYKDLKQITKQVEQAPELLDNLNKFNGFFTCIVQKMLRIDELHDAIIDHFELGKEMDREFEAETEKIKHLLRINVETTGKTPPAEASPSGILQEYFKTLHSLRHDITGNIIIVKNFITAAEMFKKNMGTKVYSFAEGNIIKLQGIHEAVETINKILKNGTLKPRTEDIKLLIKNIIKNQWMK